MGKLGVYKMEIKSCKYNGGKHKWRYTEKKHKRDGYRFVECIFCSATGQESPSGRKFTSARYYPGGKSRMCNYRMNEIRQVQFDKFNMGFTEFVNYSLDNLNVP